VPALDPDAPYYSRLSARSALYTDLRLLLGDRDRVLSCDAYKALIIDENCLARSSTAARRKLWTELHSRYRLDANNELFGAFWKEWRLCASDSEKSLTAYILLALNDKLVGDLGTEWLFPLLRRAPAEVRASDVRAFIQTSARKHPEVSKWSHETTLAVAQKYCASLRDFGLAKGRIKKNTVRPALYGAPVRLLVRALRLVGTAPLDLVRAPIFRLLGIDAAEAIDALGELNRVGALRFRMQGDIVELELAEAA